MNIIITTTIYPPDIGGPATYAKEMKEKMIKRGHNVKILTISPNVKPGKDVYVLPQKSNIKILGFLIHQIELFIFLVRFKRNFDVIYTLNPGFLGLISCLSSYFLSIPLIIRFGGDRVWETAVKENSINEEPDEYFRNFQGNFHLKSLFYLQQTVLKLSKKVIVPSESIKETLVNIYKIKKNKINVIHTSVEVKDVQKPLNREKLNILYAGRLIKLKRVDMIIESMQKISSIYPDVLLTIAGDGPEKNNLEELSRKIGLNDFVTFLGNVKREKISNVYLDSDIFILNSIYEVFPNVIIEAMKYKVPVITSSKGGAREIVTDEKTGLIVYSGTLNELEEKIIHLIKNEELRTKLAESAYNNVLKKFNWNKNLPMIERELEALI